MTSAISDGRNGRTTIGDLNKNLDEQTAMVIGDTYGLMSSGTNESGYTERTANSWHYYGGMLMGGLCGANREPNSVRPNTKYVTGMKQTDDKVYRIVTLENAE